MTKCPLCGSDNTRPKYRSAGSAIFACGNCELWFRFPQPTAGELKGIYDNRHEEEASGGKGLMVSPQDVLRQHLGLIKKYLGPVGGKDVLDFGCGSGAFLRLADAEGARAVGVEPCEPARGYAAGAGPSPVYKNIDELPALGRRFDLVVLIEALEHLREPWDDIKKLSALLNPRGYIYIATPNRKALKARMRGPAWRELEKREHLCWFTERSLARLSERAGLDVIMKIPGTVIDTGKGALARLAQKALGRALGSGLKIAITKGA